MAWTFEELRKELLRARNPTTVGRLVMANTKLFLINGTKEEPACIGAKFYATMILKFHQDGAIDIYDGYESVMTFSRIYTFAGVRLWNYRLPSVNGRRPSVEKVRCISKSGKAPAVFRSLDGYIRVKPNGEIDLGTVKPLKFEAFTSVKEFNRRKQKVIPILQSIKAQSKLGRFKNKSGGTGEFADWFSIVVDKPLHEIDFLAMPHASTQIAYNVLINGDAYMSRLIDKAKVLGCTTEMEIKQITA